MKAAKAKTKRKSDFLGSKIDSFPQLCLRVSGLCWYAGIELQKEAERQGRDTLASTQVIRAFIWKNSAMGWDFWDRLDLRLTQEGAYYHAQR
jgi:hypothetical protein